MVDVDQILELVIRPALQAACLWSESAERLVYGTGLVESKYKYLKQISGPALGYFQCEPSTHDSIKKYLSQRSNNALLERILSATYRTMLPEDHNVLMWDIRYATLICRVHYFRFPFQLPDSRDAEGLAKVYLKYYNTPLGKSTFERCIDEFRQICS